MAELNSTPKDFYVYIHRRKTDGRVFYVGKGSGRRAYSTNGRSIFWNRVAKKHGFIVEIVQSQMQEWWSFEFERELIAYYDLKNLCNSTNGGEGISGLKRSKESIEKGASKIRGKNRPLHVCLAVSKAHKGKSLTKEHKEKLKEARKNQPINWKCIEAMRLSRLGSKTSDETKAKISVSSKNAMSNQDVRNKIRLKKCKIVICSNGIKFFGTNQAAQWIRENTRWIKAGQQNIVNCCNGITKSSYGFTWSYAT